MIYWFLVKNSILDILIVSTDTDNTDIVHMQWTLQLWFLEGKQAVFIYRCNIHFKSALLK